MVEKDGKFEGNNPFDICKRWIAEAEMASLMIPTQSHLAPFPRMVCRM